MTDYLGKTESKSSTSPSADASNVETIGGTKTFEYIPPALLESRDIANKEINFSVTCTGNGGSTSVTKSIPVYEGIFGQVVDGPIGNATVFIDENENGVLDSGESSTVSESDGSFLIKKSNSPLTNSSVFLPPKRIVALGGNDSSTLVSLDKIFLIHDPADDLSSLDSLQCSSGRNPCNVIVSPLTTIAAFMEDPALNLKLKHLNLSELDSIYSYNHWEGGFNSDLSFPFNLDQFREKNEHFTFLALGLLTVINGSEQNQIQSDTKNIFKSLAKVIESEYLRLQSPVNIESEEFINKVLTELRDIEILEPLDSGQVSFLSSVLSNFLIYADQKDERFIHDAMFNFATYDLLLDLSEVYKDPDTYNPIKKKYQNGLADYISSRYLSIIPSVVYPKPVLIDDSFEMDEDTSTLINPLINDDLIKTADNFGCYLIDENYAGGYLSSEIGVAWIASPLDCEISFEPTPNFFGIAEITYVVQQGARTSSASIKVEVNNTEDPPEFKYGTERYGINVSEGIATNTWTSTSQGLAIEVSDPDGDPLTLSLGGQDQSAFNITQSFAGQYTLWMIEEPNYEAVGPDFIEKREYKVNITASDGKTSVQQDLTFNIVNVDESHLDSDSDGVNDELDAMPFNDYLHTRPLVNSANIDFKLFPSSLAQSKTFQLTGSTTNDDSSYQDGFGGGLNASWRFSNNSQAICGTYGSAELNEGTGSFKYTLGSNVGCGISEKQVNPAIETFNFKKGYLFASGDLESALGTITINLNSDPLYKHQWYLENNGQKNFADSSGSFPNDLNIKNKISDSDTDNNSDDGIRGAGVVIAVVDDGIEIAHEDLKNNVLSNYSYNFLNGSNDPTLSSTEGSHGNAIAGIIAAEGWNNIGVRGIAPSSKVVGYNLLEAFNSSNHAYALGSGNALATNADVDIFNLSYGPSLPVSNVSFDTFFDNTVEAALLNGVTNLRGGKGAIYVRAAGNDWRYFDDSDSNGIADRIIYCGPNYGVGAYADLMPCDDSARESTQATPYLITVGSNNSEGYRSVYSTPGANIWINGFGGSSGYSSSYTGSNSNWGWDNNKPAIMTIDDEGCSKGYVKSDTTPRNDFENRGSHSENSNCSYTSLFGGTSAAAPTVAGVIALMLEINPDLTWRDVKHILAITASEPAIPQAPEKTISGVTQYSIVTNAAGHKFHPWTGFGRIDGDAAITAAQSFSANNLGNFINSLSSSGTINLNLPSASSVSHTLSITAPGGSNGKVEFVRLGISLNHARPYDVGMRLESPSGTIMNALIPFTAVEVNPAGSVFEIGLSGFYEENMAGDWKLYIDEYTSDGVDGTLVGWDIRVYGN